MLESDLDYENDVRFHCVTCRERLKHFYSRRYVKESEGSSAMIIVFECRLCGEEIEYPAVLLDIGELSQFLVKR